jgi:UDP-N-acetylmuramoylalanine--D-glutamate ligase
MNINSTHTVLILGLGESGLACARWCAKQGAALRVADTRDSPPQLERLNALAPQAQFMAGALTPALLEGVQAVVRSPGLSPAVLAELKSACEERGIAWLAELDLFVAALKTLEDERSYSPKLVAITGTNGKTTVARLCGILAERAGKKARVAGNISPAMLDALCDELEAEEVVLPEVWCLELSSFQLHGVAEFNPDAATILNITQDHLDWHADMPAYAAAKAKVFGEQTVCVFNRQDEQVIALVPKQAASVSFGLDLPSLPGDFGLETTGALDWLVRALADESVEPPKRISRSKAAKQHIAIETTLQRIMPADALLIRGRHNAANALAALALLTAIDLPLAPMLHGLREYRGEPHRVEWVAQHGGVDYFDDSKGTNVGATVAALSGLGRKVVLIVGGLGKGQDFNPLAAPVAEFARTVLIIGKDADVIHASLATTGISIEICESLDKAVSRAAKLAQPGDAVLLSPACASFDMFRDYEHRAQVFVDAVHMLTHTAASNSHAEESQA